MNWRGAHTDRAEILHCNDPLSLLQWGNLLTITFYINRERIVGSRRKYMWELLYNYIELIIGFYYRDYLIGLYRAIYSARYRVFAREKNFKIVAILAVKKATDRNKPLHHGSACV